MATAPKCDERTRAYLITAAKEWLATRKSFFATIQQLHIEVNAAACWATAGGELGTAEAAELDLLGLPAAGTA